MHNVLHIYLLATSLILKSTTFIFERTYIGYSDQVYTGVRETYRFEREILITGMSFEYLNIFRDKFIFISNAI